MKKVHAINGRRKIAIAVILVSVGVSLALAVNVHQNMSGQVLGVASFERGTVLNQVERTLITQMHAGYGTVIFIALMALSAGFIYQLVMIVQRLESDCVFGCRNIAKIVLIDLMVFVVTVAGLAAANAWIIAKGAPQELTVKRIAADLIELKWQSRHPAMTQVVWGYEPDKLENVGIGVKGTEETIEHEILVEVEPGRAVYLIILAHGGLKYGEGLSDEALRVPPESSYELVPLELVPVKEEK